MFETLKIKNLELTNRIVMAPMCMYQSDDNGFVNNFHLIHYGTRAIGGVGLILIEATAVEKRGRITNRDLGLWDDEHILQMKLLVDELKKYGTKVGVQLAHAGRKCGVENEKIIAPSSIAFSERYGTPNEMTHENIKTVVEAFKNAARRANEAGFDTIEIHAAHGYLINQFLSPLTNTRDDEYGGIVQNRVRFLIEILDGVKQVWPEEKPIIVRVSAEEFKEAGLHPNDLAEILNLVKQKVDVVNVSSGGVVQDAEIVAYPGYQVPFAQTIKKETNIITIAGGLITTKEMIEEILNNNRADLVFLGRELLRNPYFVLHSTNDEMKWPKPYRRGK